MCRRARQKSLCKVGIMFHPSLVEGHAVVYIERSMAIFSAICVILPPVRIYTSTLISSVTPLIIHILRDLPHSLKIGLGLRNKNKPRKSKEKKKSKEKNPKLHYEDYRGHRGRSFCVVCGCPEHPERKPSHLVLASVLLFLDSFPGGTCVYRY